MKLLLDENISRRIVPFIQNSYPLSTQVSLIGLDQADDKTIRQYAIDNDFVIVTKDADFYYALWPTAQNSLVKNG